MRGMLTANTALKEWALVIEALAAGDQMILVRKGGIRDPKGAFQLQHREFFLYPTWEHQTESAVNTVRPEFQAKFKEILQVPSSIQQVPLKVYGGVSFCGEIRDPAQLAGLEKFHIWKPEFFAERMKYRPQAPTLVVLLRAYRIIPPVPLPVKPEYAGCKSWVPLSEPVSVQKVEPVIDDRRFRQVLEEISDAMSLSR